jgi:hypothetical protein
MTVRWMLSFAIAASGAVILSGCTVTAPEPVGPTSVEITGFYGYLQVPNKGELRIGKSDVTANLDRRAGLESCMDSAGYVYSDATPSINPQISGMTVIELRDYEQAQAACWRANPADPTKVSLLGIGQRKYLYDYYVRWLVPCLEFSGHRLTNAPTREEFLGEWRRPGWWSPYEAIYPAVDAATIDRLTVKCAAMPPGLVTG